MYYLYAEVKSVLGKKLICYQTVLFGGMQVALLHSAIMWKEHVAEKVILLFNMRKAWMNGMIHICVE